MFPEQVGKHCPNWCSLHFSLFIYQQQQQQQQQQQRNKYNNNNNNNYASKEQGGKSQTFYPSNPERKKAAAAHSVQVPYLWPHKTWVKVLQATLTPGFHSLQGQVV